jgi:anti-anti-sigma regulatory factor
MLRIKRAVNGEVVLTVSGRMHAENLVVLKNLIDSEAAGRPIVLDLKGLTLVDREAVKLLEQYDADGIRLRNCPPYIREWVARVRDERLSPSGAFAETEGDS